MPRFQYRALSAAGEIVSGVADGPDAAAIIARLHEQALLPIDAVAERTRRRSAVDWRRDRARGAPLRNLARATRQLSRLVDASLPLDRALDILTGLADARSAAVWRGVLERVRDGAGLAEALAAQGRAFPPAYVSMVRAGEEGGALPAVLSRLADFLARAEANRQQIVSALIYPALLVIVATLSVALVLTVVLPQFEPLFEQAGASLPTGARIVMALGDGLRAGWWAALLAVAAAAAAARQLLRYPAMAAARDRFLLRLPLVGDLVRKFDIGRFARTFGVLLSNGVAAPRALALAGATIGNRVLAAAVESVASRFKEGEALSAALSRGAEFPPLAIRMIELGEQTARLEELLEELGALYDDEVEQSVQRLIALLVPAVTIAMGIVIALIIVAVMTAMISINDLAL